MYKKIVSVIICVLFAQVTSAQVFGEKWKLNFDIKAHEKGQWHFAWGYSMPRLDNKIFDYHKEEINYSLSGFGPFHFKTEYGLKRNLSILLSTNYILYKSEWQRLRKDPLTSENLLFTYNTRVHDISANVRLNYHVYVDHNWDIYLGGGIGYNYFIPEDNTTYLPEDSSFNAQFKVPQAQTFEMTAGIRYFFMTRTAIYLEVGYGKSLVQGGFVFKFRQKKRE